MEIIKRNQMKILDLKSTYWQQKSALEKGSKAYLRRQKRFLVNRAE